MRKIILLLFSIGFLTLFGFVQSAQALTTTWNYIKIKPFNSNSIEYRCEDIGGGNYTFTSTLDLAVTQLIDTNSFALKKCAITCTQAKATEAPIIGISFTLGPKNPSGLLEKSQPPILFETSVSMRNYKK